ncbi:UV damage repair protein UvrX [Fervidibacillus halotolerans]|uniref:UV damage repair protein UvrX n=1 Tax=Fervidibacillus halotolerans TaxID=2980027 RepID=A0A9E8RZX5_9BACI|nr:UV damage repair protein UvrX [Fervidibacillus halotolerans]WAA13833.1 UV damage repair protein UvrX [Fervidibacillus halotolerans]
MVDYSKLPHQHILCIDMKSFYASCSAVMLGLDPLDSYVVVAGNHDREGSVVLAASPKMKKEFGIKTGSRLFEVPDDPRIHIVEPKMATYLRVSTEITRLLYRYVPKEAIHVYSVDESFIKIDGTRYLWGDAYTIAEKIRDEIQRQFQLPCAIGIGPNMLLAKLALDLEAKQSGIAYWSYRDVPEKLWPITPLHRMWGIGKRLEKRLNGLGIFSVGQLAHYDLATLEGKFGIIGNQLYYHAWGVDLSEIGAPIMDGQISFGKSQILLRDYKKEEEIRRVILEMSEEVARRARSHEMAGRTISLGIGYSYEEMGGGFYRSKTIDRPTNITMDVYRVCLELFYNHYDGRTVRQISISISNVVPDRWMQLDLFEPDRWKKRELGYTMDRIRYRFGSTSLLRAVSYAEGGTERIRAKLVGGHKA